MFILYWIFFVILLYIYGKILFPLFENVLTVIFQPDLAQGMSFFLIFILSVVTLAKFLDGDFHIFFSKLFSNKGNSKNNQNDIKKVEETESNISSEKRIIDKYYQTKKDEGLIKDDGLIKDEDGGNIGKFLGLFFIIFFSLIFWVMLVV